MTQGRELVLESRYFTLFAPRQSGKSTFFTMLGEQLKTEGYKVCYTNFEYSHKTPLNSFLLSLGKQMREDWGIDIDNSDFGAIVRCIEACKDQKIVQKISIYALHFIYCKY